MARVGLVAGSLLFALLAAEFGCRLLLGPEALFDWKNFVLAERTAVAKQNLSAHFEYDPVLGYVQRGGVASAALHFDSEGYRVMPPPADARDGSPVLATGDSFTLGDEVADTETWPALLQALLKRRTVNAGVAAYGIDQTVLRTERLAGTLHPSLIVVGFIGDDLRRAEMRRTWGVEKPYFELKDGELVLRNVPVPPSPRPADTLSLWNWALGWSVAFDSLLQLKGWRYEWLTDHARVLPRGEGERLACPLMKRLARLGVPTLVVAQYDFYVWVDADFGAEQHRKSQVVLRCAEQAGLAALDTYDATQRAVQGNGRNSVYGSWHPNSAGYRMIAELIANELARRHMLP